MKTELQKTWKHAAVDANALGTLWLGTGNCFVHLQWIWLGFNWDLMTCHCTPEVWQPELLTQVRIRLLPCVLQVSEAAAFACDPAKETQETVFQSAGRQLLIIHSQFCHLRDRSAWIHILLLWVLKLTQLGPLRADSTLCTQGMYHVSVHLTVRFQRYQVCFCLCAQYLWGDVFLQRTLNPGRADHWIVT